MAGGCVACSSGRDVPERSTSGPQIMSSATDTARAAPHTITAVRFHRGAGRCASDHRWLRKSGMKGRTSGCLSSASATADSTETRSEEHTSELQSRLHLVCRLLLEKKKKELNRHCTRMR